MATKKTQDSTPQTKGGKAKRKLIVDDPPVVVGGGNSTDIIFKNTATNPSNPPGKRKFRLASNTTSIVIYDGINPGTTTIPVSGTFWVEFF